VPAVYRTIVLFVKKKIKAGSFFIVIQGFRLLFLPFPAAKPGVYRFPETPLPESREVGSRDRMRRKPAGGT
jgi:hypothetical protein